MPPRPPSIHLLAAATAIVLLAVYALRLCPGLYLVGDSPELVTAAAVWGVPHAPGYPLFTLIAHAFTWLPFASLPWRVHLTSAVFHALACGVVVLATFSVTRDRLASLAAGVALGLSRSFFFASLFAEVFPLNDVFFAVLLLLALAARQAEGMARRRRLLVLLAVACGLASTNQQTIAFAAPALLVLAMPALRATLRTDRAGAVSLLPAFLIPFFLAYALVPLAASRSPALSWGDVHDLPSLLHLVTRQDYGGLLHASKHPSASSGFARVRVFTSLVVQSMGVVTLGVAAGGLVDQVRRAPGVGLGLMLAIGVPGPAFAWILSLPTDSTEGLAIFARFTTMAHVPLAIAFGAGVAWAVRALSAARGAAGWSVAASAALLGWLGWSATRARHIDLSGDDLGTAFAHDLVLGTTDGALVLLTGDEQINAALYVCAVERRCGTRIVIAPGLLSLPWRMAQVRRLYPSLRIPWSDGPALPHLHELVSAAVAERPVYLYPDLTQKDPSFRESPLLFVPQGLLERVWAEDALRAEGVAVIVDDHRSLAAATCDGCRELTSWPSGMRSWQTIPVRAYEAAYSNAGLIESLAHDSGEGMDAETRALVKALWARAAATAARAHTGVQGGDESLSR